MVVVLEPNHNKAKSNYAKHKLRSAATPPLPSPSIQQKLSEAVRVVAEMIQKSMTKRRITTARAVAERGRTLGRSLSDLVLRHNAALGCSSHDVTASFVSPRDYEFSCTSSPPRRRRRRPPSAPRRRAVVHWVPPAADHWTPPAAASAVSDEFHVDRAAEEFIERFYRELMMQKWTAAREGSDRFG